MTKEKLKSRLHYDQVSGVFTWKNGKNAGRKAGWIRLVAGGEMRKQDILKAMRGEFTASESTLDRAAKDLNVKKELRGFPPASYWSLEPQSCQDEQSDVIGRIGHATQSAPIISNHVTSEPLADVNAEAPSPHSPKYQAIIDEMIEENFTQGGSE